MARFAAVSLAVLAVTGTLDGAAGLSERTDVADVSTNDLGRTPAQVGTPVRSLSSARTIDGLTIGEWHARAVNNRRTINRLNRIIDQRGTVREAIDLACVVYGNCSTLWRKARCETGGTFNPAAYNHGSHASGLFQFLPSTWAGTPFGRLSIWSPYANALAAGWMHQQGRGGEWQCR